MRRVLVGAILGLSVTCAYGQNATWVLAPGSSDFDTGANWSPAVVPTGTASFGASSTTSLTFSSADTLVGSMQFNAGAPAYSFAVSNILELNANGLVNNSSNAPTINDLGGGGTFFENASTAGNATITNNGAGSFVEFANTSTAGNASIINSNGGGAFFVNTSTANNASITNNGSGSFTEFTDTSTAGSATITNSNGGSTFFIGTSTAGSANIITNSGSFLEFSNSSAAGNAIVTTNSGGTTAFQNTASGGQGQFITNAGGSFDISGISSSGISVGSIAGAGTYALGSKQLTVGSNNLSTVVSGQITDGGLFGGSGSSLVKVGTGTLTLSGNNTYSGATNINGGTLDVTGSINNSSGVTVNSGGTLTGTGTIDPPTVTIASGGTLTPGRAGAPGTSMTITGNLAFQSGALYVVYLNPLTSTFANVTGTASLAGTVNANFASGMSVAKQYVILQSANIAGSFSGLTTTNLPSGFAASLAYTSDDVLLKLTAQLGALSTGGLNVNQQNVANALNNSFNSGGALPPNFVNVFGLSGSALGNALTQLDGEAATGAERGAFQIMTQFLGLMLDPFVYGRAAGFGGGGAIGFAPDEETKLPPDISLAYAPILNKAPPPTFGQRWTAWGSAYGGSNSANGDTAVGSSNVTAQTFGFAAGMDYHVTPSTTFGFALAGGGTDWGLASGLGSGRSDALQAGVYGITYAGPAYLSGALAFTNHWFTTNRSALGDQLTANFDGQSYGARFEGGYRYAVLPTLGVTPYAALQAQDFHTPAYSESDATGGGFGLSYAAMNATDVRTEIGGRFDAPTVVAGMPLILRARAAWAYDFVSNPALSAAFETLPGGNFTVNGAPIPRNSALASAGAELFVTPRWTLLAKFDGEFANGSQTYTGSGTLRYTW
jgi:autotransporter-associated beta strand protein